MPPTRSKKTSRSFAPLPPIYVFDLDETIMESGKMLQDHRNNFANMSHFDNYSIKPIVEILRRLAVLRSHKKIHAILLLTNNQDRDYVMKVDSYLLKKLGDKFASETAKQVEHLKDLKSAFFFDNIHWLGMKQRPNNQRTQLKKINDVKAMLDEINYNTMDLEYQEDTVSRGLSDHVVFFDDNTVHPLHQQLSPLHAFSKFTGSNSYLTKFRKRLDDELARTKSPKSPRSRRRNKNWRR